MEAPQNRAPAALTSSEPFVSAHTRAMVVVALFVAYIAVALSAVAARVAQLALPPFVLFAAEGDQEQLTLGDLLQFFVGLATVVVFVSLVVAFLVWLHRAARNLPALGNPKSKIEYTPGWAVGGFFIPFANLYMPYKAVKEVWEKSDPAAASPGDDLMFAQSASPPPWMLGWWVTWVASNVLANISWRIDSEAHNVEGLIAGLEIFSDLFGIVSAALAIVVVRAIDRRQAERARHVTYAPHLPPPPPIFGPQPAPAAPHGDAPAPPPAGQH